MPFITKSVGAGGAVDGVVVAGVVVPVVAVPGTAVAELGACSVRLLSQTSEGRTSETSRSTRSQAMRPLSALCSAVTRAACSPFSVATEVSGALGAGTSASSARAACSSVRFCETLAPSLK